MDRTPLQRMMQAALLHSMRALPLYPPAPPPDKEGPAARSSVFGEFLNVGSLPRDPFADGGTDDSESESLLWHEEAAQQPLHQKHLRKRDVFVKRFQEVRGAFMMPAEMLPTCSACLVLDGRVALARSYTGQW